MKKKIFPTVVLLTVLLLILRVALAENLYTDGKQDIRTCVLPGKLASIDLPCEVQELYYSSELQADIKPKAPKTVVFAIKPDEKEGTLTAVCSTNSYTLIIKAGKSCDNHKVIIDSRYTYKKKPQDTGFNTEEMLNQARGLMKAMVKGEAIRGYEIKPFSMEIILNNDDFLKAEFQKVYAGSSLIGFVGKVKNHSHYIDKTINVKKIMQKGWVLLYIEGLENETITLSPQEEKLIFIVTLLGANRGIPYLGVK